MGTHSASQWQSVGDCVRLLPQTPCQREAALVAKLSTMSTLTNATALTTFFQFVMFQLAQSAGAGLTADFATVVAACSSTRPARVSAAGDTR